MKSDRGGEDGVNVARVLDVVCATPLNDHLLMRSLGALLRADMCWQPYRWQLFRSRDGSERGGQISGEKAPSYPHRVHAQNFFRKFEVGVKPLNSEQNRRFLAFGQARGQGVLVRFSVGKAAENAAEQRVPSKVPLKVS